MSQTIVVTGASSGIGKALSKQLASLGHFVIATGRNEASLESLRKLYPEKIQTVQADLTRSNDLEKIVHALPNQDKTIYLVHNAGIASPQLLDDLTEENWNQHYLTNERAVIFLTQQLLPYLKPGGRVLNISTGLAHRALKGFAAYGISKAAIYMWKEYANIEFKERGISFGSVMPGIVDTPIQDKIRHADAKRIPVIDMFKGFAERHELLDATVVAKFIAWLLLDSPSEEFIKGDWDIYDQSHHHFWAQECDIKMRK